MRNLPKTLLNRQFEVKNQSITQQIYWAIYAKISMKPRCFNFLTLLNLVEILAKEMKKDFSLSDSFSLKCHTFEETVTKKIRF